MCHQYNAFLVVALAIAGLPPSVVAAQKKDASTDSPYLVQLKHKHGGDYFCTGTLVHENYVVSAAHCLLAAQLEDILIVGGTVLSYDRGIRRSIAATAIHPHYDKTNPYSFNDICVFKLNQPMVGEGIKSISLCSQTIKAEESVNVSGWGKTFEDCKSSTQVSTVKVSIMDDKECQIEYPNMFKEITTSSDIFCTGALKESEACLGDSGGPAIFQNQLCGVASWTSGVFTNVFQMRSFIKKAMTIMSLNTYNIGGFVNYKFKPLEAYEEPYVNMSPETEEGPRHLSGKECRELLYIRMKKPKRIVPAFTYQALQSNTMVEPPKKLDIFKKRPVKQTFFQIYLSRGDIPVGRSGKVMSKKNNTEFPLKWYCTPEDLDYCYYLPIFVDGLSDSDIEIRQLAQYGAMDMILKAPQKVLPVLPKMILPFKRAFNTRDKKIIIAALKVLQLMVLVGPCVGQALVPYYRQLLAVCNLYKNINVNLGNFIDPDRDRRIADVIEDTLCILEQSGGPNAFINIKYMIPTYESCVYPRYEAGLQKPNAEIGESKRS